MTKILVYDPEKDPIELVNYNPQWPALAESEIKKLKEVLSDYIIDIQHVGSTAIPTIKSKPIIDIQIAVDSLKEIKQAAITILESLGYVFWDKNPDSERMVFIKGLPPFGKKRSHHVHIVEKNSKHWHEKILFRDYLRSHPDAATAYETLKLKLENQYKCDREKYTDAKTEFINYILRLAQSK